MRLGFEITYSPDLADISKRALKRIAVSMFGRLGLLYENTFKMRHFESGAASRYGYRPRSAAHIQRKARAVARNSFSISPDANNDLIMTGALRRAVKMRHIPRAYPTRVTINMPTPSYAQMKPRRSNMPNLGAEIVAVSADERAEIDTVAVREMEEGIFLERFQRRFVST